MSGSQRPTLLQARQFLGLEKSFITIFSVVIWIGKRKGTPIIAAMENKEGCGNGCGTASIASVTELFGYGLEVKDTVKTEIYLLFRSAAGWGIDLVLPYFCTGLNLCKNPAPNPFFFIYNKKHLRRCGKTEEFKKAMLINSKP